MKKNNELNEQILKFFKQNSKLSDKKFLNKCIDIRNVGELQIPIVFYKDIKSDLNKKSNIHAFLMNEDENTFPEELGNLIFSLDGNKSVILDDIRVGIDVRRNGIGSMLLRVFEDTCLDLLGKNTKVSGVVMPEEIEDMKKLIEFYQKNSYNIENNGSSFPRLNKTLTKKLSLSKPAQLGE